MITNVTGKLLLSMLTKYKSSPLYLNTHYTIIHNKHKFRKAEQDKFLLENKFIHNKKIITISPGGYKGIYSFGVCSYIKDNFNLDGYIFSGASAGAWNALMMCYKYDYQTIKEDIVDMSLKQYKSPFQIENSMKHKILSLCNSEDFDLTRLFVGVTTIDLYKPHTTIYSGFTHLEDALNACIASSHIPLLTGGIVNTYNNKFTFDGGFSSYPYLFTSKPVLHITPSMWSCNKPNNNLIKDITHYTTLFSKNKFNFDEMYSAGYSDARKNKAYLKYVLENNEISE